MLESLLNLWQDRTLLREIVEKNSTLGALLFVFLQALQVVIAPLPGEVTGFMAGFLFGAILGTFLSMGGIIIGSSLAFFTARLFKKHFLYKYERHPFYLRIKKSFKKHGLFGLFLLYLFPGFPKDLLNYLTAFVPISYKNFLIISTLGRAPGTFALALQGDVVYGGQKIKIFLISSLFLLTFMSFILLKSKFEKNNKI